MEILKNYVPKSIAFYPVDEKVNVTLNNQPYELPKMLFIGATRAECELLIRTNAEYNRKEYSITAKRLMDEYEKTELKESIVDDSMNHLPVVLENLDTIEQKSKDAVKEAKAEVDYIRLRIKEAALELKSGIVKMEIGADDCFTFVIGGKIVTYAFVNDVLTLVKTADLSPEDASKWYNSLTKNNDLLLNGFFSLYAEEIKVANL